jgi:hypothetical protein
VVGRIPMVELVAQRGRDDGTDKEEGGGHRCVMRRFSRDRLA